LAPNKFGIGHSPRVLAPGCPLPVHQDHIRVVLRTDKDNFQDAMK
jgi:hypothetical protein